VSILTLSVGYYSKKNYIATEDKFILRKVSS